MPRHRMARLALGAPVILSVLAWLPGCQEAGPSISGRVTVDDVALSQGTVSLRPLPGTKGPSVGGKIVDGRFRIGPAAGLVPGKYRVEITSLRDTGETVVDPSFGTEVSVATQFLPARFNTRSELEVEVSPSGSAEVTFALSEN